MPESAEPSPILVARAQSGDRRALDLLLRAVQRPLHAHLRLLLGDRHAAEDALQETLFLVSRKLPALRDPRWFRAWCYRIATREAGRRARHDRWWRAALPAEALAAVPHDEPAPRFEPELRAALPGAVAALPRASGLVLRLHYLDGLTYVEIAEALELPLGTVKSRQAYALAALRRALGPLAPAAPAAPTTTVTPTPPGTSPTGRSSPPPRPRSR